MEFRRKLRQLLLETKPNLPQYPERPDNHDTKHVAACKLHHNTSQGCDSDRKIKTARYSK